MNTTKTFQQSSTTIKKNKSLSKRKKLKIRAAGKASMKATTGGRNKVSKVPMAINTTGCGDAQASPGDGEYGIISPTLNPVAMPADEEGNQPAYDHNSTESPA